LKLKMHFFSFFKNFAVPLYCQRKQLKLPHCAENCRQLISKTKNQVKAHLMFSGQSVRGIYHASCWVST
jgi:hypothetical protein